MLRAITLMLLIRLDKWTPKAQHTFLACRQTMPHVFVNHLVDPMEPKLCPSSDRSREAFTCQHEFWTGSGVEVLAHTLRNTDLKCHLDLSAFRCTSIHLRNTLWAPLYAPCPGEGTSSPIQAQREGTRLGQGVQEDAGGRLPNWEGCESQVVHGGQGGPSRGCGRSNPWSRQYRVF